MPTDQYLEVYVSGQKDNVDVCHMCTVCVVPGYRSMVQDTGHSTGGRVSTIN